jgi:bisphosphoglycerate-independent phosphoglycerate mutase (AlkP superfamily)
VVLLILDGIGWRDASADNAVRLAEKPNYDALWEHGPRGFLRARGPEVGLGEGRVGDSEVGHRNIGAGRIVWRDSAADLDNLLGEVIADAGLTQLRLAAEEKFPHVTRFINGGREAPFRGEDRLCCIDVAHDAVRSIEAGRHDFILINIADADIAGHGGDLGAAIAAVEAVDAALGRIARAVRAAGGALLVTSDHGNCELMRDPATGRPHTGHTGNDVPVILMAPGDYFFRDGRLADVAPTVLKLLGVPIPPEMTGRPLLRGNMEGWNEADARAMVTFVL